MYIYILFIVYTFHVYTHSDNVKFDVDLLKPKTLSTMLINIISTSFTRNINMYDCYVYSERDDMMVRNLIKICLTYIKLLLQDIILGYNLKKFKK